MINLFPFYFTKKFRIEVPSLSGPHPHQRMPSLNPPQLGTVLVSQFFTSLLRSLVQTISENWCYFTSLNQREAQKVSLFIPGSSCGLCCLFANQHTKETHLSCMNVV